jgi:hypothetical protein
VLRSCVAAALLIAVAGQPTRAGDDDPPAPTAGLPDENTPFAWRRCANGARIEGVRIERVPVFDPDDPDNDLWVWRLANTIHSPMQTRRGTILSLLTLAAGDACSVEEVEEAERVLRGYSFIQDAWVRPMLDEDGRLILLIRTQDAWSTSVGISFSNEGGESRSKIKLLEENLFGTGSHLEWERDEDQDRTERRFIYKDPALFGSRWQLRLEHSDNSDGLERAFRLDRPFRELSDRWSFLSLVDELERIDKVYDDGIEIDRWQLNGLRAAVSFGASPEGLVGDRLFRWDAGIRVDRQRWTPADPGRPVDRVDLRPYDRDLLLLELGGSWRRVDYRREQHLDTARRVQDLDVGREIWARAGISAPGMSNDDGGRLAAGIRTGFELPSGGFLLLSGSQTVERLRDGWVNGLTSLRSRLYRRFAPRHTFYLGVKIDYGVNLEGPRRFLLGGDTGLRGYSSRAFTGERQVLAVAEHRYFADWELWSLFRIGLVSFVEVGGAWDQDDSFGLDTLHPDVGFGVRALLLPSSNNTTLHLNVAVPLDSVRDDRGGSPRFSFTTVAGF